MCVCVCLRVGEAELSSRKLWGLRKDPDPLVTSSPQREGQGLSVSTASLPHTRECPPPFSCSPSSEMVSETLGSAYHSPQLPVTLHSCAHGSRAKAGLVHHSRSCPIPPRAPCIQTGRTGRTLVLRHRVAPGVDS